MTNTNPLLFQYCQKLIVLSTDKSSVLLAKRKGELDFDGTYSFIGGKMETTDESLEAGMRREKNEEIGEEAQIKVYLPESYNILYRKKDGNAMILPHIAAVHIAGVIKLNNEYSDYKWVSLDDLEAFEPKIEGIEVLAKWAVAKISAVDESKLTLL